MIKNKSGQVGIKKEYIDPSQADDRVRECHLKGATRVLVIREKKAFVVTAWFPSKELAQCCL